MQHCFRFFQNRECEYFPCHPTGCEEEFNCLFCYCPLYTLGEKCGGSFSYTERGIKNCTGCIRPHRPEGYDEIIKKFPQLAELARKKDPE